MGRLFPERIVIYPRDVEILMGKCDRSSRELLRQIKAVLGKPRNAVVTLREFCYFTGMDEEEVREELRRR
ncbi:hypothetical protein ACWKWU_13525 [Chitinophaga lutea]